MNKKKGVLLLGIGNMFRRDDGVGIVVINACRNKVPEFVDVLDGGTDGLSLIEYIKNYPKVIIVDAVDIGKKPGDFMAFLPEEVKLKIKADSLSTHGFGLADVIQLVKKLNIKTDLTIIGIQPKDIAFGEGLSEEINIKLNEINEFVLQHLKN
jgi:hydrogenase maturation protease